MSAALAADLDRYNEAFTKEADRSYPLLDSFESEMGHALDRDRLLGAARVLACPLKKNPPCWQHGRLLYAVARQQFALVDAPVTVLDVGTAKGFSALCLQWALTDSGKAGLVTSVDVLDPNARIRRNTVAELDGFLSLRETLAPWPESQAIDFRCMTGIEWLREKPFRVEVAFIDGKHSGDVVAQEARILSKRQQAGDVAVFDDVHLPDVRQAVESVKDRYALRYLELMPHRAYAIGVRL